MVKTPRMRSGGRKAPAVIDLGPEDVRRMDDAGAPTDPLAPDVSAFVPPVSEPSVPDASTETTPAETAFAASESLAPDAGAAMAGAPESDAPLPADAPLPTPEAQTPEPWTLENQSPESRPPEPLSPVSRSPESVTADPATPEAAEAADSFRFAAPPEASPEEIVSEAPEAVEAATEERIEPIESEASGPQPGDASTPLFADPPPVPPEEAPILSAAAPAAAPAPGPARRGVGSLMAAGLVGGVLALILMALLQFAGWLPGFVREDNTQFDALRAEIAALRDNPPAPAPDPGVASAIEALQTELAQLKESGSAQGNGTEELQTRLGDFQTRLGDLEKKLDGLAAGAVTPEALAKVGEQAANAEAQARTAATAAGETARRVEALEGSVAAMGGKVDALGQQPKVALALAAAGLKEAAGRGAPFEAELATLRAIAPDLPELDQLQPYAAKGVATRETLEKEWNAAADAMVASATPADPDAGLMSRLWTSAGGLISVRPIGAVEGADVPAVVARMEAALHGGDLARTLAEYDTLPEAAKEAGAAWAEKARGRLAVEGLIERALASAMKGS